MVCFGDPLIAAAYAYRSEIDASRNVVNNPRHIPAPETSPSLIDLHRDLLEYVGIMLDIANVNNETDPQTIAALDARLVALDEGPIAIAEEILMRTRALLYTQARDLNGLQNMWLNTLALSLNSPLYRYPVASLAFFELQRLRRDDVFFIFERIPTQAVYEMIRVNVLTIATKIIQTINRESALIFAQITHRIANNWQSTYGLAEVYLSLGRVDFAIEALADHRLASYNTWDEAAVKFLYPELLRRTGRNSEALEAVNRLTELDTTVLLYGTIKTPILAEEERWIEITSIHTKTLNTLANMKLNSWYFLFARGMAHERAGLWSRAERDLLQAIDLFPEHPDILNYLAYSWVEQDINLERSLSMLEKAVLLRPNDGAIIDSLGWAHFRLGNFEKAVYFLERAISLTADSFVINEHLGDAYWRVGREREARFLWRSGSEMTTNTSDRARLIDKHANGLPSLSPT